MANLLPPPLTPADLLAAELTLTFLSNDMQDGFRHGGINWPRDKTVKHFMTRDALITTRKLLVDLAEAATDAAVGNPLSANPNHH